MVPLGASSRSLHSRQSVVARAESPAEAGGVSVLRVLEWPASIAFCAVFPALTLGALFVTAVQDDGVAMDFRQFYWAAEVIRDGGSPYGWPLTDWGGPYPYPPLPALVVIPLTALPLVAAGLLVMLLLAGS